MSAVFNFTFVPWFRSVAPYIHKFRNQTFVVGITGEAALAAFHRLTRIEGILPALESSHAVAHAIKLARELPKDALVLCNLSGRGDKDVHTIAAREGLVL